MYSDNQLKQDPPAQHQEHQPGDEAKMQPQPDSFMTNYKAAGKLEGKVALISGGDSGIGRAVAIGYAMEGADVAFIYLDEDKDAQETIKHVEEAGKRCLAIKGDIGQKEFCEDAVRQTIQAFGDLHILVNNAAEQHVQEDVTDISEAQLKRTFNTNVFGMFYLTQAALEHIKAHGCIINTASIVAYKGNSLLIDYGASKGAVVGFTR